MSSVYWELELDVIGALHRDTDTDIAWIWVHVGVVSMITDPDHSQKLFPTGI